VNAHAPAWPRAATPPARRGATARLAPCDAAVAHERPELLLLDHCAAQIAADAGADAVVHAIAAPRQALVLRAAIAAVVPRHDRRGRDLVYLPRAAVALLDRDELLSLLRGLAARHGDDALLVVAVESSARSGRCGIPVVEHLARAAGWEMSQLWSDGTARHALVVFERASAADQGALIRVTPLRVST
jgi:hypothetical protein